MASNFRCVAGRKCWPAKCRYKQTERYFSIQQCYNRGTRYFNSRGSFRLRLHDDTNTVTSIILHNESAANIQRKITEELGLNVSVTQSSKNSVTGATS